MLYWDPELVWPIVGIIVASAAIGLEREYRASPAGVRTHILLGLASCLLMLSAVHQLDWIEDVPLEIVRIDPARTAHGIMTGIGFLCGGVIFREGFSVRGLTTAASLWVTATLGILFGVGFYSLAIFGTVATLLILAASSVSDAIVPKRRVVHMTVRYNRDGAQSASDFTAFLKDQGLNSISVDQARDGEFIALSAVASGYDDDLADGLARALNAQAQVVGYDIKPQPI